jgi:hypothetical protein
MKARRRLLLVWLAMTALTLVAIPIGHALDERPLGIALTAGLLATVFVKASVLLSHYLDLRHAPAWNAALRAAIFILLAILAVLASAARIA